MSSVKHCQKNRVADLTNHGRPLSKCTVESTDALNKTSHKKKKLACSTSVHCNVILLAQIENKLWFIHQKPRARRWSQMMSRSQTMLEGHLRIFVGPTCTLDPQQSEDKVQKTPAQRRTRFRCLRRSTRLKKTFVGRSQQNQNPRTKPTQWSGKKLCASKIRNNTDSRATL